MKPVISFCFILSFFFSFSQEKLIKNAIKALEDNNYSESWGLCKEYDLLNLNSPLSDFVKYRLFHKAL
jgi:hypothetical protein